MIVRSKVMRSKVIFFQEIERTIMRSKVLFFMRSKVSIISDNFDQEVENLIMRSKVQKHKNCIIIAFQSYDQSWVYKNVHEIKSI